MLDNVERSTAVGLGWRHAAAGHDAIRPDKDGAFLGNLALAQPGAARVAVVALDVTNANGRRRAL